MARRLLLVMLCLLPVTAARAQEVPDGYEQGLLEVRIQGLRARTFVTLVQGTDIFLPVGPILELGGFPREWSMAGTLLEIVRAPGDTARLDLEAGRLVLPVDTLSLPAEAVVRSEEAIYLRGQELGDLLGADVTVDWTSLVILIRGREGPLPAQLRAQRERQRAERLRVTVRGRETPDDDVPFHARSGGAVLDWDVSGSVDRPIQGTTLSGRLGLGLLGGDLSLGGTLPLAGRSPSLGGGRYRRVFPDSRLVRQVEVGDVSTGGVVGRSVRGVFLTNSPRLRGGLFDQLVIAPDLPPGWDYEVYQSGRLLGFSESGDPTPVHVPLMYGSTPIEVRMLGPVGQEVTSSVLYHFPAGQLPPGAFEYSLAGGSCRSDFCDGLGSAEARVGLSRWVTLGLGGEVEHGEGETAFRPMARARWSTPFGLTGGLEALPGAVAEADIRYSGPARTTVSASGRLFYPGGGRLTYLPTTSRRWQTDFGVSRPSIRFSGRLSGQEGEGLDHWRLTTVGPVARGLVRLHYERDVFVRRGYGGVQVTQAIPAGWLPRTSASFMAQADGDGLRFLELEGSWQSGDGGRVSAGTRWSGTQGASLVASYSRRFGYARASGRLAATSSRGPQASVNLGGSIAWEPGAQPVFRARSGTGLAGVAGTVFRDLDGDGERDPDEPAAEGIHVLVGGERTRTDENGMYRAWAIEPYSAIRVAVDTLRGIAPSWMPVFHERRLRLSPNVFTRVDIPLIRTVEVAGLVQAGDRVATAAGVTLVLTHLGTGEATETQTFSDGQFYISRVQPGRYRVRVRESSLEALDAVQVPEELIVDVRASEDEYLVDVPPIELRRR